MSIALAIALVSALTWSLWPSSEPPVPSEAPAPRPVLETASAEVPVETAVSSWDRDRPIEDIVEDVLPAVVTVISSRGKGSGFFVENGIVVTNHHVVGDDYWVDVKVGEDVEEGRVRRVSEEYDLALVDVTAPYGVRALELSRIEEIKVGQEVLVIGAPLELEASVTRGIVSAFRAVGDVSLVQTDAAINPGNSGGPVIGRDGRVIGVATMKAARGEAIGFAVASNHVALLLQGGGSRVTVDRSTSRPPESIDDLDERQLEQALESVVQHYASDFARLRGQVERCRVLAPRLQGLDPRRTDYELGRMVLEYVDQANIYQRQGRSVPSSSDYSCIEGYVRPCYEAVAVYDEVYKAYVSRRARLSRSPTVERHFPPI